MRSGHGRQWTTTGSGRETPAGGNFAVLIPSTSIPHQGDSQSRTPPLPSAFVSSTATVPTHWADQRSPRALLEIAIATAVLVATLAQLAHGGIGPLRPASLLDPHGARSGDLDLLGSALAACSAVPLVAWRRAPLAVFTTTAAASVLLAVLEYPRTLTLGPGVALCLLAASRAPQTPWTRRTTLTVTALFVAYLAAAAVAQATFPSSELLHSGLVWVAAWFAGERSRLRREQIADLHERAQGAERDAERERLLAAAEERARIARDLHDSAGHAINVIAVRAGAARLRHRQDPDRTVPALEAIEQLARHTATEIDHIVGTLRQPTNSDGAVEAPPGLASLDTLIAQHTAAGLTVTLDISGTPHALRSSTDQGAYRILQEALTNASRHGTGTARIQVTYRPTGIDITIANPVSTNGRPRTSGGHGLIGMRERATLLGGSLDLDRTNGTFRIHAHIPDQAHGP